MRGTWSCVGDEAGPWSEYLAESFINKVDDVLLSSSPGGFDPILCAQDVPQSYSLDGVVQEGDHARVNMSSSFLDHAFTVVLQHADQRWLISDVLCEGSQ